jgi:hypothetical protein
MITHHLSIVSSPREHIPDEMPTFNPISQIQISSDGETVTIGFYDGIFQFHSQGLHDAQVDDGPSKIATEVFTQILGTARAREVSDSGAGFRTFVDIGWENGETSTFPVP